jgi:hypothetical protein
MGPDPTPEDVQHLRGVRVARADPARVLRVGAVLVIVVLAVSAIVLTVSAAHQNARLDKLRHHGVPVQATVSGCVGISSGIAMAIEYWECRATYTLDGHQFNEVIRGSRANLTAGQTVPAVAVPGDPALLSTPAAAAGKYSAWSPYIAPIILGALAMILLVVLVVWSRWRHRATP